MVAGRGEDRVLSDRSGTATSTRSRADGTDVVEADPRTAGAFNPTGRPMGRGSCSARRGPMARWRSSRWRPTGPTSGFSPMPRRQLPAGVVARWSVDRVRHGPGRRPRDLRHERRRHGSAEPDPQPGGRRRLVRAVVVARRSHDPLPERGANRARRRRQDVALGAARILIQAALLAGFALVAMRRGPLPFGSLALLVFAPTALMTVVSDEYRFIPGALLAGVARRPAGPPAPLRRDAPDATPSSRSRSLRRSTPRTSRRSSSAAGSAGRSTSGSGRS